MAKTNMLQVVKDGWENVLTGLGTTRDKRLGGRVRGVATSTDRTKFENIYLGNDVAATIVDLPAREMLREWIDLQIAEASESSLRSEQGSAGRAEIKQSTMQGLEVLQAQAKLTEALTWAGGFGGSLVFLGVDDGIGHDPSRLRDPLNEDSLRSFDFLTVFDRFDVSIHSVNQDMTSPKFGEPETYLVQALNDVGRGVGMTNIVHASRFLRFDGVLTPRMRKQRNGGWSDSVYVRVEECLRDFNLTWDGVAHLMQDISQAVLRMKGLAAAISSDNDDLVLKRMQTMDICRGVSRLIPLDSDSEDFQRIATPLAGVPEILDRFMLRLSAAARMPATLLFGQSPAGLSATGESDIRFFYDQIKARQERELRGPVSRILELLFKSASGPTRGKEPESWTFTFNPLWQLSDEQEANVRKVTAETDQIYIQNGVLTEEEVTLSRFGGDRYSTETTIDKDARAEDRIADERFDLDDDGVCDPGSPNYDPKKCAERKAKA